MYQPNELINCGCCGGLGYQRNDVTGINEPCPCCGGSGKKSRYIGKPIITCKSETSNSSKEYEVTTSKD